MTRLYYDDEPSPQEEGLIAGALRSAIRGKRGQRFLRDLIAALDALPSKELSAGALEDEQTGCCCAFGAVRRWRGAAAVPLWFDPMEEDLSPSHLAEPFNVSETLAWAVVAANESCFSGNAEPERRRRWEEVKRWALRHLESSSSTRRAPAR